jgi:hypothetical protein
LEAEEFKIKERKERLRRLEQQRLEKLEKEHLEEEDRKRQAARFLSEPEEKVVLLPNPRLWPYANTTISSAKTEFRNIVRANQKERGPTSTMGAMFGLSEGKEDERDTNENLPQTKPRFASPVSLGTFQISDKEPVNSQFRG